MGRCVPAGFLEAFAWEGVYRQGSEKLIFFFFYSWKFLVSLRLSSLKISQVIAFLLRKSRAIALLLTIFCDLNKDLLCAIF